MIHLKANIDLNPKNKGKFTEYCKRKGYTGVTCQCICEALKSNNTTVVKRAVFAYNFGFRRNGKKCECVEKLRKSKNSLSVLLGKYCKNRG